MQGDQALGAGISFISVDWEFFELPILLKGGLTNTISTNIANILKDELLKYFNITSAHISMGIRDGASAALKVTENLIDEESNKCLFHVWANNRVSHGYKVSLSRWRTSIFFAW